MSFQCYFVRVVRFAKTSTSYSTSYERRTRGRMFDWICYVSDETTFNKNQWLTRSFRFRWVFSDVDLVGVKQGNWSRLAQVTARGDLHCLLLTETLRAIPFFCRDKFELMGVGGGGGVCIEFTRHCVQNEWWTNVGLMLAQRCRRWTAIIPTLIQRLVFAR